MVLWRNPTGVVGSMEFALTGFLRDGEHDHDASVVPNKMIRKASFKLSWCCKGDKSDQKKHDVSLLKRKHNNCRALGSKQISLVGISPTNSAYIDKARRQAAVRMLCSELVRWLKEQKSLNIVVEPRVRTELLTESSYYHFVQTWENDKEFCFSTAKAASMFKGPVPPVVPFSLRVSLGFMTPFYSERYKEYLDSILRGPISITLRHRLQCHVIRDSAKSDLDSEEPILVLNEVTIDRGISSFLTNPRILL
ncbi:hypothetical protein HAX54_048177 [Datura stramonium]|uniref:Uncharacterized protein n=1 Tax=Datura stramonium TaxID=4076 RepID=A0ABS8SU77_DATST|nr:hypothetical protein [Datura stramonium]